MVKTTLTASFPKMPDMDRLIALVLRQAVGHDAVQSAFARGIAEPNMSEKHPPMAKMTAKQRRYVFANIQLPYQRTGGVVDQWRLYVAETPGGASVILQNPSPAAQYVYGTATGLHQQQFLKDNGWTPTPEIKDAVFRAVVADVKSSFTPRFREALRISGKKA